MSLTADDMRALADDARDRATESCRSYLAEAVRSVRDTGDPIDTLALLHAMWSGYARRPLQKDALDAAGDWLEQRLLRAPGIPVDRLVLELGWLQRLIAIHVAATKSQRADDDAARERDKPGRRPAFGAHIEALRRKRAHALQAAAATATTAAAVPPRAPTPPPVSLPNIFEVRFSSERDAIDAFKTARDRIKKGKPPKQRVLPVRPVHDIFVPIAGDIVCALPGTEGITELGARFIANSGQMPSFWIATADLAPDQDKRHARRILLDPIPSTIAATRDRDATGQ